MIKQITFQNIYSFEDEIVLEFNSNDKIYAIIGANSYGKSSILDIIENINHSLWDSPNYNQLRKIVNQNTDSPIISVSVNFTFNNLDYTYKISIDTQTEQFTTQQLTYTNTDQYLINYNDGTLVSSFFTSNQIETFKTFDIARNGLLPYIKHLTSTDKIDEIKQIIQLAQNQDFIELDIVSLRNNENFYNNTLRILQQVDSDIIGFEILNHHKRTKIQIQKVAGQQKERLINKCGPNLEINIKHSSFELPLYEESSGIKTMFNLCLEIFAENGNNYFQPRLIDDFGSSLHDDFIQYLLDVYRENINRQVIFTSNKGVILEKKLLPKEAIFVVDKQGKNSSVKNLSEIHGLRTDQRHNWEKMYNQGKFGGKPRLKG